MECKWMGTVKNRRNAKNNGKGREEEGGSSKSRKKVVGSRV